jgi:hypothetical protein
MTFCKPDVLKPDVLKPDVLKPDVLKPDVLWVYHINRYTPIKIKINYNFVKFVATKKGKKTKQILFPSTFVVVGSGMDKNQDPR